MRPQATWPRTGCSGSAGAKRRLSKPAAITTRSASASSAPRASRSCQRAPCARDARDAAARLRSGRPACASQASTSRAGRTQPRARMPQRGVRRRQAGRASCAALGVPGLVRPLGAPALRAGAASSAARRSSTPLARQSTPSREQLLELLPGGADAGARQARQQGVVGRDMRRQHARRQAGSAGGGRVGRIEHRHLPAAPRQAAPRRPRRPGRRRSPRSGPAAATRVGVGHARRRGVQAGSNTPLQAVALGRQARRLAHLEAALRERIAHRARHGPGGDARAARGQSAPRP